MKLWRSISAGLALATWFAMPSLAATVATLPGRSGHVVIAVTGRIEIGDAAVFVSTVKQAGTAGKFVDRVQLNSPGGRLREGAMLAAAIRSGKLATLVGADAVCASACFLAFAAGEPRFAAPGALIGVHKASENGGLETRASGAATRAMAQFAKELGVPSSIVARMVATPAKEIGWLDSRDLHAMGVKTISSLAQARSAPPVPEQDTADQLPGPSATAIVPPGKQVADRPSWNEFIERTIALSAEQNQGSAALTRSCRADSKECIMAVRYLLQDGRKGIATAIQDASGNITRREVCESNLSNDMRDCLDWETGARYRDVKNAEGVWVQNVAE